MSHMSHVRPSTFPGLRNVSDRLVLLCGLGAVTGAEQHRKELRLVGSAQEGTLRTHPRSYPDLKQRGWRERLKQVGLEWLPRNWSPRCVVGDLGILRLWAPGG